MAVTYTYTLLRENVMGHEKVMDWQISAAGTYTTGGDSFTPAQLGLDAIDFISIQINGGAGNTNGVALVAPDLTNNKWVLWGTGAADTDMFDQLGNGTTVSTFGFFARVFGVA